MTRLVRKRLKKLFVHRWLCSAHFKRGVNNRAHRGLERQIA